MRVLVISVDVSNLSDEQIDNVKLAMEAQVEVDFSPDEAYILSSDVRFINEDGEDVEEIDTNLH
jgi:hypothetical protein